MRVTLPECRKIVRSLAMVSLFGCGSAFAEATYELALQGTVDHFPDCWEDLPLCESGPPPHTILAWTGRVTLDVASSGDGIFSDPALLSFDFDANVGDFSVPGDTPPPSPLHLYPFFGSVTIADGRVTSIDANYYFAPFWDISLNFSGLSVAYTQPPMHHFGPTTGVGFLTMVPEPAPWRLLLCGLLVSSAIGSWRGRQALTRRTAACHSVHGAGH